MSNNKSKVFLIVTSILSTIILLIGTTFSLFTYISRSDKDALVVSAAQIRINLGVSNLYAGHYIIPLKDELIDLAYERRCIDDTGRGACLAYTVEVFNSSVQQTLIGSLDFQITNIENLSYMILDEDGNRYVDITHIDSNNSKNLSLGEEFTLDDGRLEMSSKKFTLLVWLTDNDKLQDESDAGGFFTAAVTFRTADGAKITGRVQGIESSSQETSVIN